MSKEVSVGATGGQAAGEDIINEGPHIRIESISGGNNIIGHQGDLHIKVLARQQVKVVVPTGPEHISDAQATDLQRLVLTVVQTEQQLKKSPANRQQVWGSLNAHCRVPSYRLIRADDFDKAEKYLRQWIGRLNSMASAPVKTGDAWRKRHYAYIKINSKDDPEAVTRYIARNFKATSLTELDNAQLERVYRYVAGRKKRS